MPRSLNTNVFVNGTWYGPGQVPPAEVAELITNPKVWDGDELEAAVDTAEVKQPNRKGPGSGGTAWKDFAASKGVTEDFDSKEALIAHLEDKGLIDKE
jgi:hypothetical protein